MREEEELKKHGPLALRLRPATLDGFAGQKHLVGIGKPLRRLIECDVLSSLLFYGPPGTGKTTLAEIVAARTQSAFVRVNAVSSSVAELRRIMEEARRRLAQEEKRTILFIDEIHRFNKAQQDALLPAVEKGIVVLIGATTENPYFTVNAPLLSRMRVFPFEPLEEEDIRWLLRRMLAAGGEPGLAGVVLIEEAEDHIIRMANGDARSAINALELGAALALVDESGRSVINRTIAEEVMQRRAVVYDRDGDTHFDVISAYIKSIRGSDPDAALYWLAKMIEAGEDPLFIARRLVIAASEDVGNADPHGLLLAVATAQAVQMVGMPEARIALAQATCYLAAAPKSNASYVGISEALTAAGTRPADRVPAHLRDASYKGAKQLQHGSGYLYPHDFPGNFIAQEYLPEGMQRPHFYRPGKNGYERSIAERLERWEKLRNGEADD
jgi:putative ATPase